MNGGPGVQMGPVVPAPSTEDGLTPGWREDEQADEDEGEDEYEDGD